MIHEPIGPGWFYCPRCSKAREWDTAGYAWEVRPGTIWCPSCGRYSPTARSSHATFTRRRRTRPTLDWGDAA